MDYKIDKLNETDIHGLIKLSNSIGWDYDKDEILTIMASGIIYGHKDEHGQILSSAAIIPYGPSLASIGMVIVNQDYRGMGLGRKVTQKCLDSISSDTLVMLIATEEGKPMYESMGFHSIDFVHKYLCDNYTSKKLEDRLTVEVSTLRDEDLLHVVKLDRDALGEERKTFLINRINQAQQALVVKNFEGKIVGFGLSILGPANLILGPIVAPTNDIAALLIDRLANHHQGRLRIDVPSGKEIFMSHLEKCGFVKVSQPPIMIKNANQLPTRNKTLYGIAAQVFG